MDNVKVALGLVEGHIELAELHTKELIKELSKGEDVEALSNAVELLRALQRKKTLYLENLQVLLEVSYV